MINAFRWIGRLEGISFLLLLLIAMPLKYFFGEPALVKIVGMAHGGLFLVYILAANYVAMELNWTKKVWFLSFVSSVLPLGTFIFEKRYLPEQR
jgi:integral membrane protein